MKRTVENIRGEDKKRQVGEEMCGKEAMRRVVKKRRGGKSCGNKESRRAVIRRRGQKL